MKYTKTVVYILFALIFVVTAHIFRLFFYVYPNLISCRTFLDKDKCKNTSNYVSIPNTHFSPVSINQIPPQLRAVIIIEDRDFFKHDRYGLTAWKIFVSHLLTIYNNYYLGKNNSLASKLSDIIRGDCRSVIPQIKRLYCYKEQILLTIYLDTLPKNKLLEIYFNETNYGANIKGIGAASKIYFNKTVQDLNITEGAILSGISFNPSGFSPCSNLKDNNGELLWKKQTMVILYIMNKEGYIDKKIYDQTIRNLSANDIYISCHQ